MNQTFTLTSSQASDLRNGLYYVNVHSTTFSGGEIRGQLLNATCTGATPAHVPVVSFLDSSQEIPPHNSTARGVALGSISYATGVISLQIYFDVQAVTAVHIHGPALPGVAAVALYNFVPPVTPNVQTVTFTSAQRQYLNNGTLYINIHSTNYTAGEVRGQMYTTCPYTFPSAAALPAPSVLAVAAAMLVAVLALWL
jgi:hypothetical protein